jgi:antitoxin component YwqK of YwqJK toxin-antitoxin module
MIKEILPDSMMKKALMVFSGLLLFFSGFSQINLGDNGIYYDKDQKLFTGDYKEYYDNGQVKQDMTLVDGKIDGKVNLWYRSGTIKETRMFKSGLRNGLWTSYNEQGGKTGEAGYKDDLKDGPWHVWDENGILRYEMFYRAGQKSGLWIMYDEKGIKSGEKKYSDEK